MDASPSHSEFVLLLLVCIIMFNSVMCNLKVHCNQKDMNTLLNFKQGVTHPSSLLSTWFTEQDCCQWTGVQCDNITGRVTELSLPCHTIPSAYSDKVDKSHCLTGEFNLSLLELEFLRYLNLSNNDLKGIHYNSMGSQKCNDLSSGTPLHRCGNSSNLHYLDLSYNYDILIDNLNWIYRLSSLKYLNLNGIDLLHKEIDWLQSMTILPSLLELHLESCQLENIYPSLQYANFTSLEVLDLADNDFISELPSWLFNLSSDISHIELSQNRIHGQLPKTLPNLRSINSLDLSYNNLDGPIPNWFDQLEQLQQLDLSVNSFSGPIPKSLGNVSSLIVLVLFGNHLNGSLPESLGQLSNLEALRISGNSFTGVVSERNLFFLSNLKRFSLSSPALIFDFDPEWVPPFQLQIISLGYVSPKFPSWLFTQSSLKTLTIHDSSTSFKPLDKFWNFAAQLEFLSLNNNSLSGSISPLLCHKMKEKSNLVLLGIADNLLSGELTDCWNDWKSLIFVDLENNNLTGKIPHSMGSLSNLVSLYLNGNKLFGNVPLSLKNCQNLQILNLRDNNFSGAIPNWMGQSVKALQLGSNQFSGDIPPQICKLSSLVVLELANNRLSGPIPNCLHNMTAMVSNYASIDTFRIRIQVTGFTITFVFTLNLVIKGNRLDHWAWMYALDLSSNSLSGTVPSAIFNLTRLQSLNLSHNQLVGTISEEIGNMKQLESIDLSSNRLSGQIPQSMPGLSFLGDLNLSFNNFMGKIPSGTQLQGFTNLSYMGNPELCGPPLTNNCPQIEKSHNTEPTGEDDDDDESQVHSLFYMGLGIGFAVGFWGVLGPILFNRTCRHAYFRFLNRLYAMVI